MLTDRPAGRLIKQIHIHNYSEPHSQNRLCEAVLNNMPACYLLMVVTFDGYFRPLALNSYTYFRKAKRSCTIHGKEIAASEWRC